MISIQDLGLQIYEKRPEKFYIFGGTEYGIKEQYINRLKDFYGEMKECESVSEVLESFTVRHLFPPPPTLYIVRYDDSFVSGLNQNIANNIAKTKISGTIVCIYEDDKQVTKIDKFLPQNTCIVSSVSSNFVFKYLKSEFPDLNDRLINVAIAATQSYGHARTVCRSMQYADQNKLLSMSDSQIGSAFGCDSVSVEEQFKAGIAGRDFKQLCRLLGSYNGDLSYLIYAVMQTMIDLEKIVGKKYSDSPLQQYSKLWTIQDIYHMFMQGYAQLEKSRSSAGYDAESSLIYLFGLLPFKEIPSVEVLSA